MFYNPAFGHLYNDMSSKSIGCIIINDTLLKNRFMNVDNENLCLVLFNQNKLAPTIISLYDTFRFIIGARR